MDKNDHELGPKQVNLTNFALCSQAEVATHFGLLFITLRAVERRQWQSLREIHRVVFQKNERPTPRFSAVNI